MLGYLQWRNFNNIVISSSTFAKTLDQRDTPSSGQGGKIEVRPPVGGGHTLRFGSDFRRSEGDLAEYRYLASGAGNGSRFAGGVNTDFGLFVEDDWELGPVTLTGGVRADRWTIKDGYHRNLDAAGGVLADNVYPERSGWAFSYRAGAVFEATEGLRVRAAAYSGLRLPTLNELYRPFVVFPVTTLANAALENERLEGFEAGIDWQPVEHLGFTLTAFDNKVKNAITNVTPDPVGNPNTRQRQNIDAIDAQGIEFGTAARFRRIQPRGHARLHRCRDARIGRPIGARRVPPGADAEMGDERHGELEAGGRHDFRRDAAPRRAAVRGRPGNRRAAGGDHGRPVRASAAGRQAELRRPGREPVRRGDRHPQPGRLDRPRRAADGMGRVPLRVLAGWRCKGRMTRPLLSDGQKSLR